MSFLRRLVITTATVLMAATAHALPLATLKSGSAALSNGWYRSEWFGYFWSGSPDPEQWIFHNELGWLWIYNLSDAGIYWLASNHWGVFAASQLPSSQYLNLAYFNGTYTSQWRYVKGSSPDVIFESSGGLVQLYYVNDATPTGGPNGPYPQWWRAFGLLEFNQVSAPQSFMTAAHLKHFAASARAYLLIALGDSPEMQDLNMLVDGFFNLDGSIKNPAGNGNLINQGQLKNVVNTFYQVLENKGFYLRSMLSQVDGFGSGGYNDLSWGLSRPWTGTGTAHYSPVRAGQLKFAFAFDLDLDRDGMLDNWEYQQIGGVGSNIWSFLPDTINSTSGKTNMMHYLEATFPAVDRDADLFLGIYESIGGGSDTVFSTMQQASSWRSASQVPLGEGIVIYVPESGFFSVSESNLSISRR